jgi:hypothetical protein
VRGAMSFHARLIAVAIAGHWLAPVAAVAGLPASPRKLIIVQFCGGVRCSETVDDAGHRHVPRLWRRMVPHGVLFRNMRVEGKVVHRNSTGSIMTGHWEWNDLDWLRPVRHPTVFEVYRRASGAGDTKAWAFVYASIVAKVGESQAEGLGGEFGANVVEPPTIPRSTAEEMRDLMAEAASSGRAAATGLEFLGLPASAGAARSVLALRR